MLPTGRRSACRASSISMLRKAEAGSRRYLSGGSSSPSPIRYRTTISWNAFCSHSLGLSAMYLQSDAPATGGQAISRGGGLV
jgi:hypothetical protein